MAPVGDDAVVVAISAISLQHAAKFRSPRRIAAKSLVFSQFSRQVRIVARVIGGIVRFNIVLPRRIAAQRLGVERLDAYGKLPVPRHAHRFANDVPDGGGKWPPQHKFDAVGGLGFEDLKDHVRRLGLGMEHNAGPCLAVIKGQPFGFRVPSRALWGRQFALDAHAQQRGRLIRRQVTAAIRIAGKLAHRTAGIDAKGRCLCAKHDERFAGRPDAWRRHQQRDGHQNG